MSPVLEPMSFDELSELYRVEMKSNSITQVRKDLFRAMADLLSRLRVDYDKQMSIDPESVMCEGANQRRKKAERLCKDIMHVRTQKISQMAIRGALGADNSLDMLTEEERHYYDAVLDLSWKHLSEVDRLRGRQKTITTRIDEPLPPARRVIQDEPAHDTPAERAPEPEPAAAPEPEGFPEDMPNEFDDFPADEAFDDFPDEAFDETAVESQREIPVESSPETVPEVRPEATSVAQEDELRPVLIRVLEDLPPFVGPDRDYELRKEDLVTLPKIMADALVNSEKAMLIRPTP